MRQGRLSGLWPISKRGAPWRMKVSKRWSTRLLLACKVMQFEFFIGIDVSKATLDFAVLKANQFLFHQQVSNDKKGIAEFLKQLRQQTKAGIGQCLFCMEFTARAAPRHL